MEEKQDIPYSILMHVSFLARVSGLPFQKLYFIHFPVKEGWRNRILRLSHREDVRFPPAEGLTAPV